MKEGGPEQELAALSAAVRSHLAWHRSSQVQRVTGPALVFRPREPQPGSEGGEPAAIAQRAEGTPAGEQGSTASTFSRAVGPLRGDAFQPPRSRQTPAAPAPVEPPSGEPVPAEPAPTAPAALDPSEPAEQTTLDDEAPAAARDAPESVADPPDRPAPLPVVAGPATRPAPRALAVVQEKWKDCRRCELAMSRNQLLFGQGRAPAPVAVVLSAPTAEQDRAGDWLAGEAGLMLRRILGKVLGLKQGQVWLTGALKCAPSGPFDRREALTACSPLLRAQLEAARPLLVLALGDHAARLLARSSDVSRLRSRVHQLALSSGPVPLVVSHDPPAVLARPELRREVFEDMKFARTQWDALARRFLR